MLEPIVLTVPVPDNPVFWAALVAVGILLAARLILGFVSKFL